MIETGNKNRKLLSWNTSEQDRKEGEVLGGDLVEIGEVFMTDRAEAMYIQNGTAVSVSAFNVSDSRPVDVF